MPIYPLQPQLIVGPLGRTIALFVGKLLIFKIQLPSKFAFDTAMYLQSLQTGVLDDFVPHLQLGSSRGVAHVVVPTCQQVMHGVLVLLLYIYEALFYLVKF